MRLGKLTNEQLERLVLSKFINTRSETVVCGEVGEDCAVLDMAGDLCVLSTDPITGAGQNIGALAVHVCCNDAAACGAEPVGLLVTLLMPPTATEEEIALALQSAYLDEFVASLPHGLDTEIGERGVSLSGGQKQRLSIARALIRNAPLVILDEATSALDNKSEKVVQKALDRLMEGRTTIVIAHRLSTIRDADLILVVNDGEIVERGSHEELLAREGAYAALYKSQFKSKEDEEKAEAVEESVTLKA